MDVQETRRTVKDKEDKVISNAANKGTEAKLRRFLENYGKTGRVLRSCEKAGISFVVHYRRLQGDPVYASAFAEAEQAAAQHLEDKVYDWAVDGELQAALALLKRFRPQHYRERSSVEVTGSIDLVDRLAQARNRVIDISPDANSNEVG